MDLGRRPCRYGEPHHESSAARSTLWRLTLGDGRLVQLQSVLDQLGSAKLSPLSGDVLVFGSGGLSLYTDLMH